jgi:steroid 5-alpha reductase family enzyme
MTDAYDTWVSTNVAALALAVTWGLCWSVPGVLLRRNDIADIGWGLLFPLLALVLGGAVVLFDPHAEPRAVLVLVLLATWGLRLSIHIARRVLAHDEEDKRYAAWRARFGRRWILGSLFAIFVPQALLGVLIAQPVLIATDVHHGHAELGVLDAVALVLVVVGALLEATADRQLRRFLARRAAGEEPRRYLTDGAWSWSRHPNYAGDSIMWFGFGLFGVAGALDADAPWLVVPALVGPIVMWWFLRYGSGVPLTERGREGNAEWDPYVRRTSAFFPRPPRPGPTTTKGRAPGAA